jgi:hypothetical protein
MGLPPCSALADLYTATIDIAVKRKHLSAKLPHYEWCVLLSSLRSYPNTLQGEKSWVMSYISHTFTLRMMEIVLCQRTNSMEAATYKKRKVVQQPGALSVLTGWLRGKGTI